jgi:hypothetical protein
MGPRADSPNVSHSDQVLGVSAAEYAKGLAMVYHRDGWVGEKKKEGARRERRGSGCAVESAARAILCRFKDSALITRSFLVRDFHFPGAFKIFDHSGPNFRPNCKPVPKLDQVDGHGRPRHPDQTPRKLVILNQTSESIIGGPATTHHRSQPLS